MGDPDYYSRLLRLKSAKSLDNVYFHDKVLHSDLPTTLQDHDIFILPSRLEGVPRITLEAAATGLPCIIFDDYQSPSVIDGVTGFQVRTFEQMVDRVRLLVQDHQLRGEMGLKAAEHAKKFDWSLVITPIEKFFQDMVLSGLQRERNATISDGKAR